LNRLGLDISLLSTAVCLRKEGQTAQLFSYINESPNNKWVKSLSGIVNITCIPDLPRKSSYSRLEIEKLKHFDSLSSQIVQDIKNNIDLEDDTVIFIEGYSYSSNSNALIDIVAFSTLIRYKLLHIVSDNIHIIPPSSLKLQTGLKVYKAPAFLLGKSGKILKKEPVCVNNEGIPAARFTKKEMLQAYLDGNIQTPLTLFLVENAEEILKMKAIPCPINDLVDAIFLSLLP
jgi:hypothetical protein